MGIGLAGPRRKKSISNLPDQPTLKRITGSFVETLENPPHWTRLSPETGSYILSSLGENLRARINSVARDNACAVNMASKYDDSRNHASSA
jgi:hypothetical protein